MKRGQTDRQTLQLLDQLGPEGRVGEKKKKKEKKIIIRKTYDFIRRGWVFVLLFANQENLSGLLYVEFSCSIFGI